MREGDSREGSGCGGEGWEDKGRKTGTMKGYVGKQMGYYKIQELSGLQERRAREQYGGSLKNYRVAIQSSNATPGHISGKQSI